MGPSELQAAVQELASHVLSLRTSCKAAKDSVGVYEQQLSNVEVRCVVHVREECPKPRCMRLMPASTPRQKMHAADLGELHKTRRALAAEKSKYKKLLRKMVKKEQTMALVRAPLSFPAPLCVD